MFHFLYHSQISSNIPVLNFIKIPTNTSGSLLMTHHAQTKDLKVADGDDEDDDDGNPDNHDDDDCDDGR